MTGLRSSMVSSLKGVARVPGDKSISHRALMIGALSAGQTSISGLLEGEDVLRTARALISMGAVIFPPDAKGGIWRIEGSENTPLRSPRSTIYLGNSGTSARLLMGLVAGYPISAVFTGDSSLSTRPMGRVIKPLAQMGARFDMSAGDKLPLRVNGAPILRPIQYTLPVPSAQVKSAILLAGLHASGSTTVIEPVPTRDHTERMLRHFGAHIESVRQPDGSNHVTLSGQPRLTGHHIVVPADPSSAAFPAVAALITRDSDIVIPNVCVNPLRTGLYETLREMGADIVFENSRVKTGEDTADIRVRSSILRGVTVPPQRVASMIDEFPILSIAAACAKGATKMTDLGELRVKESDRLNAIAEGLKAAGVKVETEDDSLVIYGTGAPPKGGCTIQTNLDHRIAMSFLILGMVTKDPVAIDDSTAIGTSFPNFIELMNGLGGKISS